MCDFVEEIAKKEQDLKNYSEKSRLLKLLQQETEKNLAIINGEASNLRKELNQSQQAKSEISAILQKEY